MKDARIIGVPKGLFAFYKHDIGPEDDVYMRRWILRVFGYSIRLHHIRRPDGERDLHDHPFWFVSFVLRGWYKERVGVFAHDLPGLVSMTWTETIRWLNTKSAMKPHKITETPPGGVWTLVFTGRIVRRWGFHVPGKGWVVYSDYLNPKSAQTKGEAE